MSRLKNKVAIAQGIIVKSARVPTILVHTRVLAGSTMGINITSSHFCLLLANRVSFLRLPILSSALITICQTGYRDTKWAQIQAMGISWMPAAKRTMHSFLSLVMLQMSKKLIWHARKLTLMIVTTSYLKRTFLISEESTLRPNRKTKIAR